MAGQHGSRRYYQLLLQPHRADLVEEIAVQEKVRSTEIIRRMVYDWLERELPASKYKEAQLKDEAVWAQSVRNRVDGRAQSRLERAATAVIEEVLASE